MHRFRGALAGIVSRRTRGKIEGSSSPLPLSLSSPSIENTKTSEYRGTGGQRGCRANCIETPMRRSSRVRAMPTSMPVATPLPEYGPCLRRPLDSRAMPLSTQISHPHVLFSRAVSDMGMARVREPTATSNHVCCVRHENRQGCAGLGIGPAQVVYCGVSGRGRSMHMGVARGFG